MTYHKVSSKIIEDDLGELWLNIGNVLELNSMSIYVFSDGTLKNVARALDFFTKEGLVSVKMVRDEVPNVAFTAVFSSNTGTSSKSTF